MRKYGLIGYPLQHSFSPRYFADKFENEQIKDASYQNYELVDIAEFEELLSEDLSGINVTIPYKEKIISYLDELDEVSESIGAVNTIRIDNGMLKGYNTDVYGFQHSLLNFLDGKQINRALILGTGGSSKAVAFVLDRLDIPFLKVSRVKEKGDISYSELNSEQIRDSHLIINTTPLGMYPNEQNKPNLNYDAFSGKHYAYDLIYNPEKTLFLIEAEKRGALIQNGKEMLKLQAEKSWEIWNH